MKKSRPLGLVVEGKLTGSVVLRLSSVLSDLGPVKAKNTRLARRVSNFLRAGYAVDSYEQLEETRLVLIHVPDPSAADVAADIERATLDFAAMSFILSETWLPSSVLQPLAKLGSAIASSIPAGSSHGKWLLLEGDPIATRQMRRLVDGTQIRAVEFRSGRKELLFASELLAGLLPIALVNRAEQSLRMAGISGNQLYSLLDGTNQRMFSDILNHREKEITGLLTGCSPDLAQTYLRSISENHPDLGAYLAQQLQAAGLTVSSGPSATLRVDG